MPQRSPLPTLPPPTSFDFISLLSVNLSNHSPRVTFPCFSATGFCMSQMCAVPSHYSPPPPHPPAPPPPTGGVRDRIQHKPADSVTAEYQKSFERRTCFVALQALNPAERLGLFWSLFHLSLTTDRRSLRQRVPPCGHNTTKNITTARVNEAPPKHSPCFVWLQVSEKLS